MKRFGWILVMLMMTAPAWAAKTLTIQQLKDLLVSMQQSNKSDAEVATKLKQVELSEELTLSTMNNLLIYAPGPQSLEQIYVLEARCADLAPPASDLPATPAPDAAAQQAILAKTTAYVTTVYAQTPALTATKTTLRYQDNVEAVAPSSGISSGAKSLETGSLFPNPATSYFYSTEAPVASEHGAEKLPSEKDKTPWGANKMIALQQPDPSLDSIFQQAQAAGSIKWLRWELVYGRQVAVYSFGVPKKDSRLEVDICCFPNVNQAGVATFYQAMTNELPVLQVSAGDGIQVPPSGTGDMGGAAQSVGGGVKGNFQSNTEWRDFKAIVPYHGELFINPGTGIVVRMIIETELKPDEVVHQMDTRIDYGPVKAGDRLLVAPVKTFITTEVVPNGESGARMYSTRRTMFISEYKDYRPAGAK
ncbi:MAG: hypothetical protein ACLP7O_11155 [Terracidiphilus sp.]